MSAIQIRSLSLAQIATLDCGLRQLPGFPHQRVVANARMPLLGEVFALVDCYGADDVRFSIDPKFPAEAPGESASRGRLVRVVTREIRKAGMLDRVAIASVDWGVLRRMRKLHPGLPIAAAAPPALPAGRQARRIAVARRNRHRRLRRKARRCCCIDRRGCDPARPWNTGRCREGRRRVCPFHHPQDGEARTPCRPEGHPMDSRRPSVDALSHQHRRRWPHHRLPGPTPDRHGPQRHDIAGSHALTTRRTKLPPLSGFREALVALLAVRASPPYPVRAYAPSDVTRKLEE